MQIDDRPTEVEADPQSRGVVPWSGSRAAAVILIAGLVLFLTRDNAPVAEPAPNATLLTLEMHRQPIDAGAYYADTDGNEVDDDSRHLRDRGPGMVWLTIGSGQANDGGGRRRC